VADLGDPERLKAAPHGSGHRRFIHADPDAIARHPRLGDFEQGLADAVAVTDAHLVIGEPVDGEVLAELAVAEIVTLKLPLPVAIRVDLVDEHGAMLAAVRLPVRLIIAVDVEPADHSRTVDRVLPDRRPHRLTVPGDIPGPTDVDGEQARGRHLEHLDGVSNPRGD
jgi:hypothetical protein